MRSPFTITRSVIFALILREMRGRFGRVRLGAFWVVFEPLAHMVVLTTVLMLRGRGSTSYDFLVWLLVGLSPFLLCKNITLKLLGSVDANKALFSYKQIQPADAFIARTIVEFCIAAPVFLLIYSALTWFGHSTSIWNPLGWLGTLALGIIFSFSLGVIFAIISEALPESSFFLRLVFFPLYMLSGVIFPIDRFPIEYAEYILWNPYLHIIELIRYNTFENYRLYYGVSLEYVVEVCIVTLFIACASYRIRRFRLMAL